MSDVVTSGIKLTVDSTDFSAKINKSVADLNSARKNWQVSAGLMYDDSKQLVNASGQWVETLSRVQIGEGKWIDSLGRLRNAQGQLIQGLNKVQLAMGLYKNELGEILDKEGNAFSITPVNSGGEFTDILNLDAQMGVARELSNQLAACTASSVAMNGAFSQISDSINFMAKGISTVAQCMETGLKLGKATRVVNRTIADLMQNQANTQRVLNLLRANWLALGVTVIMTVTSIVRWLFKEREQSENFNTSIKTTSENLKDAERSARNFGNAFTTSGNIIAGVLSKTNDLNDTFAKFDTISSRLEQVKKDKENAKHLLNWANKGEGRSWKEYGITTATGGVAFSTGMTAEGGAAFGLLTQKEIDLYGLAKQYGIDANAKDYDKQLIDAIHKEAERIQGEYEKYGDVIADRVKNVVNKYNTNSALDTINQDIRDLEASLNQNGIQVQERERINKSLTEARKQRLKIEQDAANKSREEYIKKLGIGDIISAPKKDKIDLNTQAGIQRGTINLMASVISGQVKGEEIENGYKNLSEANKKLAETRQKQADEEDKKSRTESGIDKYLQKDFDVTSLTDVAKKLQSWKTTIGKAGVTTENYTQAKENLIKESNKELLAKLGYSSVERKATTVLEDYNNAITEITVRIKKGIIGQEEGNKVISDYQKAIKKEEEKIRKEAQEVLGVNSYRDKLESDKTQSSTIYEQRKKALKDLNKKYDEEIKAAEGDKKRTDELAKAKRDAALAISKYYDYKGVQEDKKEKEERIKDLKSTLGVDSVIEKSRTPLQKFNKSISNINELLKLGGVSRTEAQILKNNAYKDYNDDLKEDVKKFDQDKAAAYKSPEALMAGSTGVYSAWTSNQANWQNRVVDTTRQVARSNSACERILTDIYSALREQGQQQAVWG